MPAISFVHKVGFRIKKKEDITYFLGRELPVGREIHVQDIHDKRRFYCIKCIAQGQGLCGHGWWARPGQDAITAPPILMGSVKEAHENIWKARASINVYLKRDEYGEERKWGR